MKKLGLLTTILLVFTNIFYGQTPTTEKDWFTLGFNQREEYKFKESIISFTECLKINPKSAPCYGMRAMSYWNLSKYDLAKQDFDTAIQINPNNYLVYFYRGEFRYAFRSKGEIDLAIADFTKSIQLKPDYAPAYFARGESYKYKNDKNAAIADFTKTLELDPNHPSAKKELDKLKASTTVSATPQPVYRPSTPQPVYKPNTVSTPSSNSASNEVVTSVSQITDVKPSDKFFDDLQSLIERYGVAGLTENYKFNPSRILTANEFTLLSNNGLNVLKDVARRNFIPERKFAELFGLGCNLTAVSVNPIPETAAANSLSCLYGLEYLAVNSSQQPITRGKFAQFLNEALNGGISRIAGFTTKENVKKDLLNRMNALFAANKFNEIITLINQLEAKKYDFGDSKIQAELVIDYFKYEPKAIAEVKLRQLSAADNTYQTLFYAYFYDIEFQIGEGVKFKQAGNQPAARKAFQTASDKINLVKTVTQNRQELYQKEGLAKQLKAIYRAEKVAELEKLLKEKSQ